MSLDDRLCPGCSHPLVGIGSKCWECGWVRPRDGASPQPLAPQAGGRRPRAIPDTRLEREVRVEIRKTLETLGWSVYDMEQERETRQTPGPTDLIAFRGPVVAFLEIKRPQRRGEAHQGLSKDQRVFRDRVAPTPAIHRVLFDEGDAIQFHQECATDG